MLDKLKNGTDSFKELVFIYILSSSIVAFLFAGLEGRNLIDSYWWTFITGLSIGYGDIYPATLAGKILAVIWGHFTIFIIIPLFVARLVITMIRNNDEFTNAEQEEIKAMLRQLTGKEPKK